MKTTLVATTMGLLAIGMITGNWLNAQDSAALVQAEKQQRLYAVAAGQDADVVASAPEPAEWRFSYPAGFPGQNNRVDDATSVALRAMTTAKDETAKRQAEAELKTALEEDYDARLIGYEKHLDRLADELTKMREQLQKRKSAKSEMVELRLQVLKAEASDLGWPSEVNSRSVHDKWLNRSIQSRSLGGDADLFTTEPMGATTVFPLPPLAPASPPEPARSSGVAR